MVVALQQCLARFAFEVHKASESLDAMPNCEIVSPMFVKEAMHVMSQLYLAIYRRSLLVGVITSLLSSATYRVMASVVPPDMYDWKSACVTMVWKDRHT